MDLKVFTLLIGIYCCTIGSISGSCWLDLPRDPSLRPTFLKKVGSRKAVISNGNQFIEMRDGEEISAQCDTRFVKPNFATSRGTTVELKCTGNLINQQYNRVQIECNSLKWNLYESPTPFKWCPPLMVSYMIARPNGSRFEYLAGVCYNFEEMTVVSLHYALSPKFSKYLSPLRLQNYTPNLEVKNIPISFLSHNVTSSMYDNSQFQEWVKFSNYQNHSLMQNQNLYHDSYDKFGGLLDFAWWPGLRLGNWRLYEKALGQHIEKGGHAYDVLAGISGTVSAPVYEGGCQRDRTLIELADRTNRKIPLYVWHYLKSTRNTTDDDLVVIAVNSPFAELYAAKDLVFCNNICQQIDWMQKVHPTFAYKTMGLIFCCLVDDVKASQRLHGFPLPTGMPPTTPTTPVTPSKAISQKTSPEPVHRPKRIYDYLYESDY